MSPDDGMGPNDSFDGPDGGSAGPDNSAFQAPPEDPSAGDPGDRAGDDPAAPGGPDSPADISRKLAEEANGGAAGSGRSRHGAGSAGASAIDAAAPPDGSGDPNAAADPNAATDPNAVPGAAPEVLPGFDETTTAPSSAAPDEAPLDAAAPTLDQAGHTTAPDSNKRTLWVTALAFGVLLLVSAGWLWTRRGPYDPA